MKFVAVVVFLGVMSLAVMPLAAQEATESVDAPGVLLGGLRIGDEVEGELTVEQPSVGYTFTAEQGAVISIIMESDEVDSYLRLHDEEGREIAVNDDGSDRLNARIGPLQLPQAGTYTVTAESFEHVFSQGAEAETGAFTLALRAHEPEPLAYPGDVEAELDGDVDLRLYKVTGQRGDVVTISMEAEEFDAYLILSQADDLNAPVWIDDDTGHDLDALLGPMILPVTGDYFITAASYGSDPDGEFELEVDVYEPEPIVYGEVRDAALTPNMPALVYAFEGDEGDVVDIGVQAVGTLDTTLTLLDEDGAQVAFNDDADGRNPALNGIQLPAAGAYRIVVQPFVPGNYGELSIALSRTQTPTAE